MICKKCSAEIVEDGIYCPVCGARADGKKVCPKCERLVAENSVFCTYCGAKIGESVVVINTPQTESVVEKSEQLSVETKETEETAVSAEAPAPVIIPIVVPAISTTEPAIETVVEEVSESVGNEDLEESCGETEKATDNEEECITEAIICTQCGSNDIELISEDMGKCKNCGTQIVINTPKETNIITNNVNIQMVDSYGEVPLGFFELPIEMKQEEFFAEALMQIAQEKNTPDDIFIAGEFEPIKTIYCQYLSASGNVDMSYSATIGYDRKEEYYEKEKKYKDGRAYYENVKKTRTVTDWQPFSSTYKGNHTGTVNNDGQEGTDKFDYFTRCVDKAIEYDTNTSKSPAPLPPTGNSVEDLKWSIESSASAHCRYSLPGDHNKDFTSSGIVDLTTIESHVAPRYLFDYTYKDNKYNVGAHTVKESKIQYTTPSAAKENEKEIENQKTVKIFNIATFCTLLFAILSAILFPIALKITFMSIALATFIVNCVVKSKISKEIYARKQIQKKKDLIALLNKKGIEIPEELKEGVKL